jgi:hypothetical protein
VTLFGGVVWVMVVELLSPALASVAVTVQLPVVVDDVYVVLALPVLSVVAVPVLSVPQVPDVVNRTESPAIAEPVELVTAAVTVDFVPSAGTLAGLAETVIAAGIPPPLTVCRIVTVPLPPVAASLPVMVQNPAEVEEM